MAPWPIKLSSENDTRHTVRRAHGRDDTTVRCMVHIYDIICIVPARIMYLRYAPHKSHIIIVLLSLSFYFFKHTHTHRVRFQPAFVERIVSHNRTTWSPPPPRVNQTARRSLHQTYTMYDLKHENTIISVCGVRCCV